MADITGTRVRDRAENAQEWLVETAFSTTASRAQEGLFTQGSGYLHARGSLEEHFPDSPQNTTYLRMPGNVTAEKFPATQAKWGTYVPGVFGRHPTLDRQMVNLPFFWLMVPRIDGERLEMGRSSLSGYSRALNMKTGVLARRFQWHTAGGATVEVAFERFISAASKHLAVQRLTLKSDRAVTLDLQTGLDSDIRTGGYDHLAGRQMEACGADGVACRVETDLGIEVRMRSRVASRGQDLKWKSALTERQALLTASAALPAGLSCVIERHTVVTTSRDPEPIEAASALADSLAAGYDALAVENARFWKARWERCDVAVEGDDEAQRALRCSLYHLLRCHVPDDSRVSIDAKGYAGDAYFGRFFWDTEMYMLPFYLYTDPERARTFSEFRIQGLNGARANAASYGYPGARFPWESDPEGFERCPNWQYRDHEVHVTGDVVYGFTHLARACPQWDFLRTRAAQTVVETARYWMARIDTRDGETTPSLLGVMGPDEYSPISSNNAYTNRVVALALDLAGGEVGQAGGATDAERAAFARTARTLPIRRSADGTLVMQCEEFPSFADPRFNELWKDRSKGYANNVSQERLYRSKALKQADVLMLMMLFPNEFSDADVKAAWDYYLPYTTHDSSLSPGAHAIVACRLGLSEAAWSFWKQTAGIDLDLAHGGAAEGIHIANAAATWMVAVLGFAGMATAMESDVLTLRPALPKTWSRLSFPLVWKGVAVHVDIEPGRLTVSHAGTQPLPICVAGVRHSVPAGQPFSCGYAPRARAPVSGA
jgi:trehalose/maltose hydrolase-like predicted phosphorylase